MAAYFARRFREAAAGLRAAAEARPRDKAAQLMAQLADNFSVYPLLEDWAGVSMPSYK